MDQWATAILSQLALVPSENSETRGQVAAALLERDDLSDALRSWARMHQLVALPRTTNAEFADSVRQLADHDATLQSYPAVARLARRARSENQRVLSEMMCLTVLVLVDKVQGLSPLGLRHSGDTEKVAAEAFALGMAGSLGQLADHLESNQSVLVGEWPDLAPAVDAAVAMLRHPASLAGDDLVRIRGHALRGVAFALPPAAEGRFRAYDDYARVRQVPPVWRAGFGGRWANALMVLGQLEAADAILKARIDDLPLAREATWAHSGLLRGRARVWRFAGDLDLALALNDEARELFNHSGDLRVGSIEAGLELNRSAILLEIGDHPGAYAAATHARELYSATGISHVGVVEADEMRTASNPDRGAAAQLGEELIARDRAKPLPGPVRATALIRAAEAVAASDFELALITLDRIDTAPSASRRSQVRAALSGTQIALDYAPGRALTWARRAVDRGATQENRLLRASAAMLLARCQAASGDTTGSVTTAHAGLDDLARSILGLTSQGEAQVVTSVSDDLRELFDIAVHADDGDLALRVAEIGRSIRLSALMRLNPAELPDQVRAALAKATVAARAADDAVDDQTRAVASDALPRTLDDYEAIVGPILRTVTVEPHIDLDLHRAAFPATHILALSEHEHVLRWVWWAPGSGQRPQGGNVVLPRRTVALIDRLVSGNAETFPGSLEQALAPLLPEALRNFLAAPLDPIQLLITPTGRLWHVPFLAIGLPGGRRLVDAAVVTLAPSLNFAYALHVRDQARTSGEEWTDGYCNPDLSGALLEEQTLHGTWADRYRPLGSVTDFGMAVDASMTVMSTHASNDAGLAQSLRDHTGQTLTAGQCLIRDFPRVVVLGACHGYDTRADLGIPEPIGLVTVISARGATWVIGGHQRLTDATAGWILSRTYQALRQGHSVPAALRSAQRTYLRHLEQYTPGDPSAGSIPGDLFDILTANGGRERGVLPWSWALTPLGPPA